MTHEEWLTRYSRLEAIAKRITAMRHARAKRLCREAGLDPNLLGIHPHNAMCSREYGKPWLEVNYQKCRECLWVLRHQFDAYRIIERWDKRVRLY